MVLFVWKANIWSIDIRYWSNTRYRRNLSLVNNTICPNGQNNASSSTSTFYSYQNYIMKPHAFTEYKCLEKWSYNILFNSNENIHLVMYLPVLRICFVQFINTIHIKLLFHNSTMLLLRGDSEGQTFFKRIYNLCCQEA